MKRIEYHSSPLSLYTNTQKTEEVPRAILPYYGNVTDRIARYFKQNAELEIGYFPVNRLSFSLTNVKDKNFTDTTGIYKIPCEDCPAVYIGETCRDIKIRLDEHKHNLLTFNTADSGVANYALKENHRIDFTKVELIEKETNYYRRKMKESIYIRRAPITMNKDSGWKFNPIWTDLLLSECKPP